MAMIYLALLTFIAAGIGTLTGFGTSTLMIPVLAIFFPPVEAIFLVAIIHWFGNLWNVALFRFGFHWRLLLLFGVVGLVTGYLGASTSLGAHEPILLRLLGLFIVGNSLFLIFHTRFKIPAGNLIAFSGGALSGFFAGMFGMGGAIRSLFLTAFNLPKAVYIATLGAIGLLVDATRIMTYFAGGATLPKELWHGLLFLIPVSFIGAQTAKKIVDRIPQNQFRIVVAIFLLGIGAKLMVLPSSRLKNQNWQGATTLSQGMASAQRVARNCRLQPPAC